MADRSVCTVSHVADFVRRYPGEDVTFCTRVRIRRTDTAREPLPGFTLRIAIPEGLTPGTTHAPGDAVPQVGLGTGTRYLVWDVEVTPGVDTYEYQVEARVEPTFQDVVLQSRAMVTQRASDSIEFSAGETVAVAVSAKGRYVKYLPALYYRDELMGRFLMLFESFWAPIEMQIGNIPVYFDPRMTPSRFLPWLASWLGLVLDERLSEERQRLLLQSATSLLRRRGTKRALQEYLEIYIGGEAQIIEHRASNFQLGPEARLGPGIALGIHNQPHSFTVVLRVPPISSSGGEDENARLELERRRMAESIIDAEKPAHTSYTLQIETIMPREAILAVVRRT